ncbi:MAG TPA: protein phosphatase 2C domain-containing protein, partial [Thermoanaerobaculia bacterium]|nr:protein phosphatase 2C domain-containing protein [Thermoanaerobaculia bacterium]
SNRLRMAIRMAHNRVLQAIRRDHALTGMGTTVVGCMIEGTTAAVAHVGDSRAYYFRRGELELLTQDHTWVNEQVVAGYLSVEQARAHPLKNVVTRALGGEAEVVVDVREVELEDGDRLLLCSDGLTAMLSDADLQELMSQDEPIEAVCRDLVREANRRGGFDNVTVVLIEARA